MREILAAGGVVWRVVDGAVEVLVVHRPRYDDWTFPKGKADAGETGEQTALREVEEETGLRCLLGRELISTTYTDGKGRSKTVRYWEMTVTEGSFEANSEVDETRWVAPEAAAEMLSYPRDLPVLASFTAFAGLD